MLRKIRIAVAAVIFLALTVMFLDVSGTLHAWLGWTAKIQFLPALLATNFVVVAVLAVITLLFGRIYCSVICPLGIYQDLVSHIGRKRRLKKHPYSYTPEHKILRYAVFALFVTSLVAGAHALVALVAPYSAYGRIAQNLFAPVVEWINNLIAAISIRAGSYAVYPKEVWIRNIPTFVIAALTFILVTVLAIKSGREYCNSFCPVGTTLSFLSRFSAFRMIIDQDKCKKCRACERQCKAHCIDIKGGQVIDYSRCVDCFDCMDSCKFDSMHYKFAWGGKSSAAKVEAAEAAKTQAAETAKTQAKVAEAKQAGAVNMEESKPDAGRRAFLAAGAMAASALTLGAQEKKVDGGLAVIIDKKVPKREVPLTPFGSESIKDFYSRCTACQLCVSQCPNNVLRPSTTLRHLMQPEMSYEKGYCRPECTICSQVCPAGAILPLEPEEKISWHIGKAIVDRSLCVVETDGVSCGNCARHCPAGAIRMVRKDKDDKDSLRIPTVNEARCIGCGACEFVCPARPFSAIHVEGLEVHKKDA